MYSLLRNAKVFNTFKRDFKTGFIHEYYGTHDWIAEAAIELLYEFEPQNLFVDMLKHDIFDLKSWLLFGTEAPDTVDDGEFIPVFTGMHTITSDHFNGDRHIIHFDESKEGARSSPYLEKHADKMQENILLMLDNQDCAGAAFFMGALSHYIADAVYPHHLIEHPDLSTQASQRSDVIHLTSKIYEDWKDTDSFYNMNEARMEFQDTNSPKFEYAGLATFYAGFDTFYGRAHPNAAAAFDDRTYKTAKFMEGMYFPKNSLSPKKISAWRQSDWDNIQGVDNENFLITQHHNLNVAIYYTAAVFNFLADKYISCISITEGDLLNIMKQYQLDFPALMLMALAGGWATFFSIATTMVTTKIVENLAQIVI